MQILHWKAFRMTEPVVGRLKHCFYQPSGPAGTALCRRGVLAMAFLNRAHDVCDGKAQTPVATASPVAWSFHISRARSSYYSAHLARPVILNAFQ